MLYDFDIDPSRSTLSLSGNISGLPILSQSAALDTLTTQLDGHILAELDAHTIRFVYGGNIISAETLANPDGTALLVNPGPSGTAGSLPADFAGRFRLGIVPGFGFGAFRDFYLSSSSTEMNIGLDGRIGADALAFTYTTQFDYRFDPFGPQAAGSLTSWYTPLTNGSSADAVVTVEGTTVVLSMPIDLAAEYEITVSGVRLPVSVGLRGVLTAVAPMATSPTDDLSVRMDVQATELAWGQTVDVQYTVENVGWSSVSAVGSFDVQLYLFGGEAPASGNPLLGTASVPRLGAREAYHGSFQVRLPSAPPAELATPDTFKLGLWVDPANVVFELNESNNRGSAFGGDFVCVLDGLVLDPDHAALLPVDGSPGVAGAVLHRVEASRQGLLRVEAHSGGAAGESLAALVLLDARGRLLRREAGGAPLSEHVTAGTYYVVSAPPGAGAPSRPVSARFTPASPPSPFPPLSTNESHNPVALATVDVNGDGLLDIVAGNGGLYPDYQASLSVWLSLGDGTFTAERRFNVGDRPTALTVIDVNGDGWVDVLTASAGSYENGYQASYSLLLGQGDGMFGSQRHVVLGHNTDGFQLVVRDVNGDGRPDLIHNAGSGGGVLLGLGDGTFGPEHRMGTGWGIPQWFRVVDVNGDGCQDLVMAYPGYYPEYRANLGVSLGTGDGTFGAMRTYGIGGETPVELTVADFNGDGFLDVLTVNRGSWPDNEGSISVLLGLGDGTFAAERRFATGYEPSEFHLQVVDVSGDGRLDLVTRLYWSSEVSVRLGLGDGTFAPERRFATGGAPFELSVVDIDNDGHLDLVTGLAHDGGVSVLLGIGDGTFGPVAFVPGVNALRLHSVFDVNGDGRADVVGINDYSTFSVLLGLGDGTFAARPAGFGVGNTPSSWELVDVNGDGWRDVVTVNWRSADVSVLLSLGGGTFAPEQRFAVGGQPRGLIVTDVNGDGRVDLVVQAEAGGYPTGEVSLYVLIGMGDGTFSSAQRYGVGDYSAWSFWVIDVDGDGLLDLVTAGGQSVSIVVGQADGTFSAAQTVALTGWWNPNIRWIDVNGDGLLDLLSVQNVNAVLLRLGQGHGTFAAAREIIVDSGSIYPPQFSVIDVNGDGALDLLAVGQTSMSVLLGNGDGTFAAARRYSPGTLGNPVTISQFSVIDVNSDGALDLVTFSDRYVHVFLGNGDGTFASARRFAAHFPTGSPAFADINGDGWLDLLVTNNYSLVSVFLGHGNGTFGAESELSVGSDPGTLNLVDVDEDGRLDIVVSARTPYWQDPRIPEAIAVLLGRGDGTFASPRRFKQGYGGRLVDFNGDGRLDVVKVGGGTNEVVVLRGDGRGNFETMVPWTAGVSGNRVVGSVDVDRDGSADSIVLTDAGSLLLRLVQGGVGAPILLNPNQVAIAAAVYETTGTVEIATLDVSGRRVRFIAVDSQGHATGRDGPTLSQRATAIGASDLDDDGRVDLVVLNEREGSARILLAQADGTYLVQMEIPVGAAPASVKIVDLDRDGRPDILVANRLSGSVSVIGNLGGARFTVSTMNASVFATEIQPDGLGGSRVVSWDETLETAVGDFTGDGRLDFVAINAANQSFVLFAGDGLGGFTRRPGFVTVGGQPIGVVARDFDQDGGLDLALLVIAGDQRQLQLFRGDGAGGFSLGFSLALGPSTTGLSAADTDGDGLTDLLVSNTVGDLLVLRNRGDGTFEKVGGKTVALAVADLNGDGKDDVVLSNEERDRVSIQFGQREGEFGEVAAKGAENGLLAPEAVRLVDLDGDGLLDMVVVNSAANRILVFQGQEGGAFGEVTRIDVGTAPAGVTFKDLNDDSVLDMVVTNRGSNDVMILFGRMGAEGEQEGASGIGGWAVQSRLRVANVGLGPVGAEVLDTDADGLDDLLVTNSDGTLTMVPGSTPEGLPNNGFFTNDSSRFRSLVLLPNSLQMPGQIGDVNGDGLADFITANPFGNSITFVSDIGTAFEAELDPSRVRTFTSELLNRPSAFVTTDFNRDGALDLVVANRADGRFTLLAGGRGRGGGGFDVEDSFFVDGLHNPAALALAGFEGSTLRFYAVGEADENVFAFEYIFGGPGNDPGGPRDPSDPVDDPASSLASVNNPSLLFVTARGISNLFQNILTVVANVSTIADGVRPEDASESGALSRRSLTNNGDIADAIRLFQSELARWAQWLEETLGETLNAINGALGTRITTDDVGRLGSEVLRILVPPGWMQLGDLLGTLWQAVERASQEGAEERAEGTSKEHPDQSKSAAIDSVFGGEEGGTDDAATEREGVVHLWPLVAGATQTASCLGQPEIGDWTKDEEIDEVAGTWEERDDGNLLWLAPPRQRTGLGQPAVESDSGTDFELGWEEEEFGLALGLAGVASLVGRKSKCSGPRWRARDRHAAR